MNHPRDNWCRKVFNSNLKGKLHFGNNSIVNFQGFKTFGLGTDFHSKLKTVTSKATRIYFFNLIQVCSKQTLVVISKQKTKKYVCILNCSGLNYNQGTIAPPRKTLFDERKLSEVCIKFSIHSAFN